MLIFSTDPNSPLEPKEQVVSAIESGCQWIQLRLPASDSPEQKKAKAEAVLEVCRQYDMILTIENETDIVENLKVHGIHLDEAATPHALEIRRRLGPHAIIGVTSPSADSIKRLYDLADVDYNVVPSGFSLEQTGQLVADLTTRNLQMPVVVPCDDAPDSGHCAAIFHSGARGILLSPAIKDVDSVVDTVKHSLNMIDATLDK